ncbi:MAG: hypothetical protein V3V99_02510 [candidate division Zixibacteria bacterium]
MIRYRFIDKKIIAYLFLFVLALLFFGGCEEEESENLIPKYQDWAIKGHGHFIFHISPKSRWTAKYKEISEGYEKFLREICVLLEMPIPNDTIHMYIYNPGKEAKEITGRETPWSNNTEIHWGDKYPYGYELTKFLLRKKGIKDGKFKAMNEGVPFLLDFSSKNYHDKTNRRFNSGTLVSLSGLGDNNKLDSLDFATRRAESASFCGFIMFNYGLDRLFMIHQTSADWKDAIETIFQMPIERFEQLWLDFARENSNDPEGLVEDDPDPDMRIIRNE